MIDDIIWIHICTCIAAYMHVYLWHMVELELAALNFVRASDFCTDESAYLRRLVWAVDVGTDSFILLIDMHFK